LPLLHTVSYLIQLATYSSRIMNPCKKRPLSAALQLILAAIMRPCKKRPLSAALLLVTVAYSFQQITNVASPNFNRSLRNDTVPYDLSCPFAEEAFIGIGPSPEGASRYSMESGAQSFITKALEANALKDSKIIFVGDSNTRQVFSSFSCIARTAGFWKDDNSYALPSVRQSFYEGRVMLKEGYGELFFLPTAGRIQDYGWQGYLKDVKIGENVKIGPIHGKEDWLESCRERQPFTVDTYTYDAPNERIDYSAVDDRFETVALGKNDVVFFNAGLHQGFREENMAHLTELLDCMEDARNKVEDPGWPQLLYFRTNQQHFHGPEGRWNITFPSESCKSTVDGTLNPFTKADKAAYTGRLPLVGFELDLDGLGELHIGKDGNDCSHWTMPGVPDAYSKEIAMALLGPVLAVK